MKEIKNHLNSLLEDDSPLLVASYSGGNDSGYISLEIELPRDIEEEEFEDFLSDHLGYGSWSGEFDAGGQIYWNGSEFTVEGWETIPQDVSISSFSFGKE